MPKEELEALRAQINEMYSDPRPVGVVAEREWTEVITGLMLREFELAEELGEESEFLY